MHLDGARVFNAAIALGVSVNAISQYFDSVSICLSKGLGAPVGSILCGSKALIKKARRWRKVVGGGMRQAGILAAAGIVALETHVNRLADDHANASILAKGLAQIQSNVIQIEPTQTNMVFVILNHEYASALAAYLEPRNILITPGPRIRLVTHLDITSEDIETVVTACRDFFTNKME